MNYEVTFQVREGYGCALPAPPITVPCDLDIDDLLYLLRAPALSPSAFWKKRMEDVT